MDDYKTKYHKYKSKYLDLKKKLFPYQKDLDYNKLKLMPSSIYSVSAPKFSKAITDIIVHFAKKIGSGKIITECCSNVGGDTISFAKNGFTINAVELSNEEFDALKNNVTVYKLQDKVKFIHSDYLHVRNTLKQDIVYLDPPWGGPDYKKHQSLDLFLSGTNIIDIAWDLILGRKTKLVVLKLPNNFNFTGLTNKFKNTKYHLFKYELMSDGRSVFSIVVIIAKEIKNDLSAKIIVQ